jgi:hypothetical protein
MNQTNGELAHLSLYDTDSSCSVRLVLQFLQKPLIPLFPAIDNFMDGDVWLLKIFPHPAHCDSVCCNIDTRLFVSSIGPCVHLA